MCKCGRSHTTPEKTDLRKLFRQRDALKVLIDADCVPSGRTLEEWLGAINLEIEQAVEALR